jgi:hypothetical protein
LAEWAERRRLEHEKPLRDTTPYFDPLDRFPEREQRELRAAITRLASIETIEDERLDELVAGGDSADEAGMRPRCTLHEGSLLGLPGDIAIGDGKFSGRRTTTSSPRRSVDGLNKEGVGCESAG